jgi:hypothetical protein
VKWKVFLDFTGFLSHEPTCSVARQHWTADGSAIRPNACHVLPFSKTPSRRTSPSTKCYLSFKANFFLKKKKIHVTTLNTNSSQKMDLSQKKNQKLTDAL